jgi:PAS domain S-box-containing protein
VRIDDAIALTLSDVTARKAAEAMLAASNAELERRVEERTTELAEARERYRLLAEHASDMISTHALDGSYTYAAPALEELLGFKTEQLRGKSSLDFAAPEDQSAMVAARDRARQFKGASLVTWRCRRPDGSYVWLETNGRAVRDPQTGKPLWFVCSSRDVTSRKRIEGALRDSEQRLRATLETPNLVAVALDPEGIVTFCNEGLCATTGLTRDALVGRNWFDVCMPDAPVRRGFRLQLRRGTIPARFEGEIVCKDGTRRLIEWDNNVLRGPSGEVIGTVSLGVDVTETRQEETVLQLLQSVTIAAGAAEDIDSALGVILQSMCESMHWRYAEAWLPDAASALLVRHDVCYVAPGADVTTLIDTGRGLTLPHGEGLPGAVWSTGELEWLEDLDADASRRPRRKAAIAAGFRGAVAVPVMSGHQVVAVLCFFLGSVRRRDHRAAEVISTVAKQLGSVILRKRVETELRESEARLRAIVRSMKEGLIITDLEDRIQFVNERTLELTGRTEDGLIGRAAAELLANTDASDVPSARLERRRRGESDRYEVQVRRGALAGRWLEITGGPLANADGVIVGTLGTLTDVSDRKRFEEAILRARDAAEAASKAKSNFLSRMSHELRTPLNSVIGFARVLRRTGAGKFGTDDLTYLDRIQANGEHLLKLVNDILDVSRIEAGRVAVEMSTVRLDVLVREVVGELEGQPRAAGVALRFDVAATPVSIETDARLLRQILINLAGNALRFTHKGYVVVSLAVDATHRACRIDVSDTGIGIPIDRQQAIFEPFEQADSTTSRAYGGTGLGLSIARSLCDALGYTLTLASTPGEGSTFSVHLGSNEDRAGEAA